MKSRKEVLEDAKKEMKNAIARISLIKELSELDIGEAAGLKPKPHKRSHQNRKSQDFFVDMRRVSKELLSTGDDNKEATLQADARRFHSLLLVEENITFFENGFLKSQDLRNAQSSKDVTDIIDNYFAVIEFFNQHKKLARILPEEATFKKFIIGSEKNLHYWREIMKHDVKEKKLGFDAIVTFVSDILTRIHPEENAMTNQNKPGL